MEPQQNPNNLTDSRSLNPKGTLLFGFFRYKRIEGRVRVRPVWKRFFIGFAVLAVAGWLGLSAGAWWFVAKHREVANVSFFDIALPNRWDEYRRKRGEDYLKRAGDEQAQGHFREAYQLYRMGLSKTPGNTSGRLHLASMLLALGRSDMATEVLDQGMVFSGHDPEFLTNYLRLLLSGEEDERVLTIVEERAPQFPTDSAPARTLGLFAAMAAYFQGHYYQVETLIDRFDLRHTTEGRLLLARLEWERGRPERALSSLGAIIRDTPNYEDAYAARTQYLRELGRHKEEESAAVLRTITFPSSVPARVALLRAFHDSGNTERLSRELDDALTDLEKQPGLAAGVGEFAIDTGNVALADRLESATAAYPAIAPIGALTAIESRLAVGGYKDALDRITAITTDKPDWLANQAVTVAGLKAVALYGLGRKDSGSVQLDQFLAAPTMRPANLVAIANRLKSAGALEAARRVVSQDLRGQDNLAIVSTRVGLDIDAGAFDELVPHVQQLLHMRKPSNELLRRIARALGSDRLLFDPDRDALLEKIEALLAVHDGSPRPRLTADAG